MTALFYIVYVFTSTAPTRFQIENNIIIFIVSALPIVTILFYFIFRFIIKTKHVSLSSHGLVFDNTSIDWQSVEWIKVNYGGNCPHFIFKYKNLAASKEVIGILPLFNSKNAELLLECAKKNNVLIHKI